MLLWTLSASPCEDAAFELTMLHMNNAFSCLESCLVCCKFEAGKSASIYEDARRSVLQQRQPIHTSFSAAHAQSFGIAGRPYCSVPHLRLNPVRWWLLAGGCSIGHPFVLGVLLAQQFGLGWCRQSIGLGWPNSRFPIRCPRGWAQINCTNLFDWLEEAVLLPCNLLQPAHWQAVLFTKLCCRVAAVWAAHFQTDTWQTLCHSSQFHFSGLEHPRIEQILKYSTIAPNLIDVVCPCRQLSW